MRSFVVYAMPSPSSGIYEPLPTATSIRVLLLAPGKRADDDVFCWLLPSDLDWDHDKFPTSTPRPVESLSFATDKYAGDDGAAFDFPIYLDMDFDSSPKERMHPFQRYEALSYVWGVPSDQQHVFFDGGVAFPVTRNLYEALRSLRLPHSGRRLWIDALCIDQSNHEEKKVQLALLQRVYQQAEKVIAYLPLDARDQKNISELVPKILQATIKYQKAKSDEDQSGAGTTQYTGPLNSISEVETVKVATSESEPLSAAMANALEDKKLYLESFGLPPVDSPLWDSWRRLFTSPYFRRIWIAQEILLGNNLHFWFGSGEGDAEPLFLAHYSLDSFSAAMNMSYNAAWCSSNEEETGDTLRDRIVGSANALRMSTLRLLIKNDRSRRSLIQTLATVNTFDATDPRDKIYALLGWTSDGPSFTQYVNYAPWYSVEQTFVDFAKVFLERGEGIGVLLQAGLRGENDKWPSWVPHWDNLEPSVSREAARSPGRVSTCIKVDENSQTLEIPAIVLDDVRVVNDLVFEKLEVTTDGLSITGFIRTIVRALGMIFRNLSPRDPEEVFEQLFRVLAQTEDRPTESKQDGLGISWSPQDNIDALPPERKPECSAATSHSDDANEGESRKVRILRTGFHEFLNYVMSLKTQLSNLEDGVAQITQNKWPAEYQAFVKKAMATTSNRLLCVTKGESIGIVPRRTKINDTVAMFEGCDIHFILRRVQDLVGKDSEEPGGQSSVTATYRLVGPAFFHTSAYEARSPGADFENIAIV
ncbi:HET-domain-containing protein [Xylaria palmicola]|nr:HET-domain-containing protein [Xylaria palmicola]